MKPSVLASLLTSSLLACGPAAAPVCTAQSYPDDGFATNAAAELDLAARFEAVAGKMDEAAAAVTNKPTAAELEALFSAGTPSLRSITLPSAQASITALFSKIELASGATWAPVEPPAGNGGIWTKYLFSERGVDLGETVEKHLFSGTHYAEATRLMTDTATPADVDRMLALFGASPAFPMDDKAMVSPDIFSAKYAKRRTNPAAATPGPYLAIKAAFINARAAVKGGSACAAERTQAFAQIRDQWERTLLGTAINYFNAAAAKLDNPAATEADKANALHAIGEAVGFLQGLRTLPAERRLITDAQLDQVVTTVGNSSLAGSESYRFVTDSASTLDRLSTAVSQIQAARQFTADEIATFKSNF